MSFNVIRNYTDEWSLTSYPFYRTKYVSILASKQAIVRGYLVPFLTYSASNIVVTLKSGLGVVVSLSRWKWHHSKACARFSIRILQRLFSAVSTQSTNVTDTQPSDNSTTAKTAPMHRAAVINTARSFALRQWWYTGWTRKFDHLVKCSNFWAQLMPN